MIRILMAMLAGLFAVPALAAEPGVTDTEIRIGDVNPMAGPASFIGRASSIGSKIAAAEINENGGVNGRKIVVLTEDDGYVPARAFQALTKLIEVDEIFALNGTSGTASTLAMMPLIEENNLPTVISTAPNKIIYNPVRPSVFTIGASYSDAFYSQLKYIHDNMEIENPVYGLIRQDDDFGADVENGYERAVEEFGATDGLRIVFKRGTSNFAAEMAQVNQAGVNILVNGAIIAGAANILSEARKLGMQLQSTQVWSEDMPLSINLAAEAGYDYLVADYVALTGPANDAFLQKAQKYLSEDEIAAINRFSYVTYVGLSVMAEAMRRCGDDLTRECAIKQLATIENFDTEGITAPISFNNEFQLSGTALAIYQLNAETKTLSQLTEFVDY